MNGVSRKPCAPAQRTNLDRFWTIRYRKRTLAGIALLYIVVAGLWIVASDEWLPHVAVPPFGVILVDTLKDLFFLVVTGTVLYLLLKSWQLSLDEMARAVEFTRQRLERALKGLEGWWDWDLVNNQLFYSERWWSMLGYSMDEHPADSVLWCKLMHPDDLDHADDILSEALESDATSASLENRLRHKDGHYVPVLVSYLIQRNLQGQPIFVSGTCTDLTEIRQSKERLDFLAHYDVLTKLPNRTLFMSQLEHSLRVARRERSMLAILMLDLDRFKNVNDSYSHGAGDELLRLISRHLRKHLRGSDTVARPGGDEFVIMLEGLVQPEDAGNVAEGLISMASGPWPLSNGVEVRTGLSIGISVFPLHGTTGKTLLQHADAAMYQAKSEGRGCFRFFSEDLTMAARERLSLEARLHRALENGELRVYFQPQVNVSTGAIVGAEALVRWQDPQEGLIPPARFIPVAEATGLIAEIGIWVLRETCLQGRRWLDAGLSELILAVNLSSRQFIHGDIVQTVSDILGETGFPGRLLELEITESTLMDREQDIVKVLHQLRDLGAKLAMDDFGTGYSSLAYLKQFPLDVLKIDKLFIDNCPGSKNDAGIVSAIVAMGHFLGFQVLAEGVEQPEQLDFLRQLGCDCYQGYLRSEPVPAEEFAVLLGPRRL